MKKIVLLLAAAVIAFRVVCGLSFAQVVSQGLPPEGRLQSIEASEIKNQVTAAKKLIEEKGEAAFHEFSTDSAKWLGPEQALFVAHATEGDEDKGLFVIYPAAENVGEGALYMPLVNGKPIIEASRKGTEDSGQAGWLRLLEDFEDTKLYHFKTIARTPKGRNYLVVAGTSNLELQKHFIVELVKAACLYMQALGEDAFKRFSEKGSIFDFKDTYIYVLNTEGKIIFDPGNPQYLGKKVGDIPHLRRSAAPDLVPALEAFLADNYPASSEEAYKEVFHVMKKYGYAWAVYLMPKPGQEELSVKASYTRLIKVKKKEYIIGSGIYLDEKGVKPGKK